MLLCRAPVVIDGPEARPLEDIMVMTYRQALREKTIQPATPPTAVSHENGQVYALDIWSRLRRFLIMGSAAGTYYVSGKKLTKDSAAVVTDCLAIDPERTLAMITEIGEGRVAVKHDPVLFALAIAAAHEYGSMESNKTYRRAAYKVAESVCRTWTHVSHFLTYRSESGVAGRGQRAFVRNWFNDRSGHSLVNQAIKYQSRDGWAQRDALILARPRARTAVHAAVFDYLVHDNMPPVNKYRDDSGYDILGPITARELLHAGRATLNGAIHLIRGYRLPREAIPTELLNKPEIWDALLDHMGYTALLRNINKMTEVGLLTPTSLATKKAVHMLLDVPSIISDRVHPFTILTALRQYEMGHGERGNLTWNPVKAIVNALDEAVYLSFGAVQPTNKRLLLGLDVSSSMGAQVGVANLTAREVEGLMALVTLNVETNADLIGYTTKTYDLSNKIRPSMRLDEVVRVIANHPYGWTNCAAPIQYALATGEMYDAFVNYTDSETNDSPGHVARVLNEYRAKNVSDARHVVVAAAANDITLADPNDPLSLDVAGFGTDVPTITSEFVAGRL